MEYQLRLFVMPTAAGAFYAVSSPMDEQVRRLIFSLLSADSSQLLTLDQLREWTKSDDEQRAMELLYRMQNLSWVQGEQVQRTIPGQKIETDIPPFLAALSSEAKALLADEHGFYLAKYNFAHETAEGLAALSADISALHLRHAGLLDKNLGLNSPGWAAVDAAGCSRLGIWPLFIGNTRFSLVIDGEPRLN